jgi:alpha-L-rhamnosidase
VVRDLQWASGSIETLRGTVASSWRRSGDGLALDVTIPVGSTAEIRLPDLRIGDPVVKESGTAVWKGKAFQAGSAGLAGARDVDGSITFQAGSGTYHFELSGM